MNNCWVCEKCRIDMDEIDTWDTKASMYSFKTLWQCPKCKTIKVVHNNQ